MKKMSCCYATRFDTILSLYWISLSSNSPQPQKFPIQLKFTSVLVGFKRLLCLEAKFLSISGHSYVCTVFSQWTRNEMSFIGCVPEEYIKNNQRICRVKLLLGVELPLSAKKCELNIIRKSSVNGT